MGRKYNIDCPVARTLDIIGERWTILILRDLFLSQSRRFQDFLESLAGIAPNTLSNRLKVLEAEGIVERKIYTEHPPRLEYRLTKKGTDLGPVLRALKDWGTLHKRNTVLKQSPKAASRKTVTSVVD